MPAVDNRGYPIKGACDLEDVGLVSVFDSLATPQPGTARLYMPRSALITLYSSWHLSRHHLPTSAKFGAASLLKCAV